MKRFLMLPLVLLGLGLTACNSQIDVVSQQMAVIRDQKPLPIQEAPLFSAVPSFAYSAMQLKSPFLPSSLAAELKVRSGKRVYPNLNRPRQPLEAYALETLIMKGSIRNEHGQQIALIQTPDRHIEPVTVGGYLGMNLGRVRDISAHQIELVETVPDGQDGYVERPRTLLLVASSL